MIVSERELTVLYWLAHGHNDVEDVSELMGVSPSLTYGAVRSMKQKGILEDKKGISIARNPFAIRLMHVMGGGIRRAKYLDGSALDVLSALREPKTADELMEATGLSRSTVFRYIKSLGGIGAIRELHPGYQINEKVWVGLRKLLNSMEDLQEVYDCRVPCGAEIYLNSRDGVLYSSDVGGAGQKTAFTAFGDYGDESIYSTEYFTTYSGEMNLDRAFGDAFTVTEVTQDTRLRTSLLMMYLKHKDRINPSEGFMDVFRRLEAGEELLRWPSLSEVEARVEDGL